MPCHRILGNFHIIYSLQTLNTKIKIYNIYQNQCKAKMITINFNNYRFSSVEKKRIIHRIDFQQMSVAIQTTVQCSALPNINRKSKNKNTININEYGDTTVFFSIQNVASFKWLMNNKIFVPLFMQYVYEKKKMFKFISMICLQLNK